MIQIKHMALAALLFSACTKESEPRQTQPLTPDQKIVAASVEHSEPGELMVRFHADAVPTLERAGTRSAAGTTRSGLAEVDSALDGIAATDLEPIFVLTPSNADAVRRHGLDRWYVVKFDPATDLAKAARTLADAGQIERVEYNYRYERAFSAPSSSTTPVALQAAAGMKFNDPLIGYQWHYKNTGDENIVKPIKAGADIDAEPAWEICAGDPSIIVAVADEGVANNHPDLIDNIWHNEAELNGVKAVDDDKNGYRDDFYGYDFAANTGTLTWTGADMFGHGTHVAGTIAAVNNNGIGVAGVAGGTGHKDGVKIMSLQIWSPGRPAATAVEIAKAFQYAADNGAVILQNSWGQASGAYADDAAYEKREQAQIAAIDYFITKERPAGSPINGGIVVFSAGNNNRQCSYPGAYHHVICVTSFAADYTPSEFTNFGDRADIAAPGGDTEEYYPTRGQVLSTIPTELPSNLNQKGYGYIAGTSMSAPHVAGVAALGLSYAKKLGKSYTPAEFTSLLLSAVNSMDPYLTGTKTFQPYTDDARIQHISPLVLENYRNGNMGSGMVDAFKMLMQVRGVPAITVGRGAAQNVSLSKYFSDVESSSMKYTLAASDEVKARLGMTITQIDNYTVAVTCTKQGAGIVHVTSEVGQTPIDHEVAIVCREKVATGGGWLR